MKKMIKMGWLILFIVFTLTGCSPSNSNEIETTETVVEEETREEIPTPSEAIDEVFQQYLEEVRVFDVNVHHEPLYLEIKNAVTNEEGDELKALIATKVTEYMDGFFKERIAELLQEHNENYRLSEVEDIFERVSRESLYELIVLYEVEYYKTMHK